MNNKQLIENFYTAFAKADAEGMTACYHDKIQFQDPAFGVLKGDDAKNMWRMLVGRSKGQIKITFGDVIANEKSGSAKWRAEYTFADTGRKVTNEISAQFEFENGKIITHTDHFSMWKWSSQALGLPGYLLGWTPLMKKRIRQKTGLLLKAFTKGK